MVYEENTIRQLYKRLLALYPRAFKERLGESMEQTFTDLWNEKRQTDKGLFHFVLWTFIETAIGIIREYRSLMLEGDHMPTLLTNLFLPAIMSFLLILPLMIMEVVNRRNLNEGFPIPLFISMWILPMLFLLILIPIVRNLRAANRILANPIKLVLHITALVLIAIVWTGALIDQMPCFLGVPNCD